MKECVSIIVPVYKVENYLDKCVQSIVDQTYRNFEIILVDDGSPDGSAALCDAWVEKDGRVRVIHQENRGVSAARNRGMAEARGDFFCFVDSDDTIAPNLLEKAMAVFARHEVDIVVFDCEKISEEGEALGGTETLHEGILTKEKALQELVDEHINSYSCNKVYRRHVFENVLFPEGRVCFEDVLVTYSIFRNANHIYCLNEKLYFYLQRNSSVTARMTGKTLCDAYVIRNECYHTLKEQYPEIGEKAFSKVAFCALRLYDRSLWEKVDETVLTEAKGFLEEHRERVLTERKEFAYKLYYHWPSLYRALRIGKHKIGNVVRNISSRIRK